MKNRSCPKCITNWWVLLFLGIIFTGLGVYFIFNPVFAYQILSYVFGLSFIVTGILNIALLASTHRVIDGWGWYMAFGIIGILLGIYLMANIALTESVLYLVFAFWLLMQGIFFIVHSIGLSKKDQGNGAWGWVMAGGILSVIISFFILFSPMIGFFTVIFWAAIGLISSGISAIVLAVKLRKYGRMQEPF